MATTRRNVWGEEPYAKEAHGLKGFTKGGLPLGCDAPTPKGPCKVQSLGLCTYHQQLKDGETPTVPDPSKPRKRKPRKPSRMEQALNTKIHPDVLRDMRNM